MIWITVDEIYDLETYYAGFTGNINKLKKSLVDELVSLGKDGLIKRITENPSKMSYQEYNNRIILNNGNHRAYAAYILGIEKMLISPAKNILEPNPNRKLIHISEWDVLDEDEHKKYYQRQGIIT